MWVRVSDLCGCVGVCTWVCTFMCICLCGYVCRWISVGVRVGASVSVSVSVNLMPAEVSSVQYPRVIQRSTVDVPPPTDHKVRPGPGPAPDVCGGVPIPALGPVTDAL